MVQRDGRPCFLPHHPVLIPTVSMFSDPLADPLILAAPPTLSLPALSAVLAGHYGLSGRLEPLGGERDRNLRLVRPDGAPCLVKLAHPAEDVAITDFQTAALLHLEATDPGLPVPRVLRTLEGETGLPFACGAEGTAWLRVLSFLPGEPMTRVEADRAQCRQLGSFVARLDTALKGFAHPADSRRLLWDIRELSCFRQLLPLIEDEEQRGLVGDVLARFAAEVEPLLPALPMQVIHNDLNPHNILVDPEAPERLLGVIDFGDMLRAPRVQEVATACAYLLEAGATPLAAPAAFIEGYTATQPLTPAECRVLPVMIAMRMAITIAITSWRARRQPENAAYIRRNAPRAMAGLLSLARLDQSVAMRALRLEEGSLPHV